MAGEVDYEALFQAIPNAIAILTRDLTIVTANQAYLAASGRRLEDLAGRNIFDAFPDNPDDPGADGTRNLRASLERVLETGRRDTMALQKYDVEVPGRPGVYEERYWSPINAPLLGPDGEVVLIMHRVEEVTAFIRELRTARAQGGAAASPDIEAMEAELHARARELQNVNDELRQAHARESEVALALQRSMLPEPPERRTDAAVRYLPAVGQLNVCGDWYDLVELPGDRIAVAVGDVVGHGLAAAGVMGQLRSALSAVIRTVEGPARALETLGLYARSVEGAIATTAVQAVIDRSAGTLTYSLAGHLPPVLLHADGRIETLAEPVDPPLGALPEHTSRRQATVGFEPGATLVLYTDGLVERRGEDIDVGLGRLVESLRRHGASDPDTLAEKLLADLGISGGAGDDTVLLIVRL